MARLPGVNFNGATETQTVTANGQIMIFSSSGVQIGDTLKVSAGFSTVTQTNFIVSNVTSTWVEFMSSVSYPLETAIQPGNSGLVFYSVAKRFVRVEADQSVALHFNSDIGGSNTNIELDPIITANTTYNGFMEKWGLCFAIEVKNLSPNFAANVILISAQ